MKTLTVALALLLGLGLVGTDARAEDTPEALMKSGVETLYTKGDPDAAIPIFRKVLEQNPSHYGATFQLAMALERAGKRADARPLWERALQMAQGFNDQPTVDMARQMLGPPAATPAEALMTAGVAAPCTK